MYNTVTATKENTKQKKKQKQAKEKMTSQNPAKGMRQLEAEFLKELGMYYSTDRKITVPKISNETHIILWS